MAGEYVVRACYTYFDLYYVFFFIRAIRENGIALKRIYIIIYILFCLIGFTNFSSQLHLIRRDKRKKTLSVGFYYTINFILIVFFSDTHIHTRLLSSL